MPGLMVIPYSDIIIFLIFPIWRENRRHWESNMSKNKTVTTITICNGNCYTICQPNPAHTLLIAAHFHTFGFQICNLPL